METERRDRRYRAFQRLASLVENPEFTFLVDRDGKEPTPSVLTKIPLFQINILTQIRKTRYQEHIDRLAEDIANSGLEQPLIVVRLDETHVRNYLEVINALWDATHRTEELVWTQENREKVAYILVAGEMRYRAHLKLVEQKILPLDYSVDSRVHFNSSPYASITRQIKENSLRRNVPVVQEARGVHDLFLLNLLSNPDFTLAQLAKDIKISPETVSNMVKVIENLPLKVQGLIEEGAISFGIGLLLLGLKLNKEVDDDSLLQLANEAAENKDTVSTFKVRTEKYNQEINLAVLFSELNTKESKRQAREDRQSDHLNNGLYSTLVWLEMFEKIRNSGLNDVDTDPMSKRENQRIFTKLLDYLEAYLANILKSLDVVEQEKALRLLFSHKILLEILKDRQQTDNSQMNPFFDKNLVE